jgi:hypothetical protein
VGSESPSVISLNPNNQRSRQDISRARLRALENSLENGQVWVPPSPSHRKTWEEQVRFTDFSSLWNLVQDLWCPMLTNPIYEKLYEGTHWEDTTRSFPLQKTHWFAVQCFTWLHATGWGETWGYSSSSGSYLYSLIITSLMTFWSCLELYNKDTV